MIPWSPLAGGFLTGKYIRGQDPPGDARYQKNSPLFSDRAYDLLDAMQELATEKGCTPSQLALAWCMHQPGITAPIAGPRTMEQWKDNLGALQVDISDENRTVLDTATAPGRAIVPFYQADFGPHLHRW